jgi:hypothetical protein
VLGSSRRRLGDYSVRSVRIPRHALCPLKSASINC